MTTMGPTVSVFRCLHTSSSGLRPADRAADKRAGAFPSGFRQKFLFSSRCVRVRDQRSKRSRAWPRRSGDQENLRSQTPIGLRNQEFDDHFVNLYGNDYPSMKLIYPALRGGVESGPEEPIEAAPQRFFLLTVGSIGSGMIQLRSTLGRGYFPWCRSITGRATLHEVAGDSAILVDPLNMDEIADGMRLLAHMGHEERQARLSELRQRFSRNFAVAAWRSICPAFPR
jgi:hypothetical protein